MGPRIAIKAEQIIWAITRAGYDVQEFLRKSPRVEAWLEQEKKPTVRQLEAFSRQVHVPFGYLLLDQPPEESLPIPFFRSQKPASTDISLHVADTVRMLKRRQDWLVDYLEESGADPLPFVGANTHRDPIEKVVRAIRSHLGLAEDWARTQRSYAAALNLFSQKIEELRVIVTFNSIVGNNTRRPIPVEECRGLVLVHPLAPFLFVNSADAKSAQIFTLAHELAHIWLGKSAGFDLAGWQPAADPVERFCDGVAAELLVPKKLFLDRWKEKPDFKQLARQFKVSPIVIARRALDLKLVSRKDFFSFYNDYSRRLKNLPKKSGGGGDFYATARKRISPTFAGYINAAVRQESLLHREAYQLTGLKGDTYANFMDKLLEG
jgi:Zn-dependent peptidase ImmA (M78 family)